MAFKINMKKISLKPTGKNNKLCYYVKTTMQQYVPSFCLKRRYEALMAAYETRRDRAEIDARVDYYCQIFSARALHEPQDLSSMPRSKNVYYRDFFEYARYFNPALSVCTLFGDNTQIGSCPSIVKSRPIAANNQNDIVLNLDKVRHFTFLNDTKNFLDKKPTAIYRAANYQPHRIEFMKKYFGSDIVDCGDTSHNRSGVPDQWRVAPITLYEHLNWRYIMSLEGNDVASNLKWIMSSNSIAVMPKPKFETWFMEGRLIGGYHYIEIREDYSDLPEKLAYYNEHLEEAQAIIDHAHEWIDQFMDQDREDTISLLVLKRYFELTHSNKKLFCWQ